MGFTRMTNPNKATFRSATPLAGHFVVQASKPAHAAQPHKLWCRFSNLHSSAGGGSAFPPSPLGRGLG